MGAVTSYDADVIAEWDTAARSRRRQAHIHPAGLHGEAAYDESGYFAAGRLVELFADAGLDLDGARVLDYGCGDGRVALPMMALGAAVVGCDSSPAMRDAFRGRHPRAEALPVDILPRSGPYDGAYCLAVLIHQRWEAAAAIIAAIAAELRPGGIAVLDLPCYTTESEGGSAFGVTTFAPDRIAAMCIVAGLQPVRFPGVNPGRYSGKPGPDHGSWTVVAKIL